MKKSPWFKTMNCERVKIDKYKSISDNQLLNSVTVEDPVTIKSWLEQLNGLPVDGSEKISWSKKAKKTLLNFYCGEDQPVQIEVIDGKIKYPSTGFLSERNLIEDNFVSEFEGLVKPDLNTRILKIKNHPIQFKNFTVIYTGKEQTPQPADGPTVGSSSRNFYKIIENRSANIVTLDIFDGQIPPQPQGFVVEKKIYYLLTYEYSSKQSLHPKYFSISEKLPKSR